MFEEFCPPTPKKPGKPKYCKRSPDGEHCWDWRVTRPHLTYWNIEWYCVKCGKKDSLWWEWTGFRCKRMCGVDIVLYALLRLIK